jgi:TM2 domain-containing membrane protein YozV
MKNSGLAAVLSFFIPGLGQIYNGQIGKGLIFIFIQLVNLILIFITLPHIYSLIMKEVLEGLGAPLPPDWFLKMKRDLAPVWLTGIGFIAFPVFWIWGMMDAYNTAENIYFHRADPTKELVGKFKGLQKSISNLEEDIAELKKRYP